MQAQHKGFALPLAHPLWLFPGTHIKQLDTVAGGDEASGLSLYHRGQGEGTSVYALEEIAAADVQEVGYEMMVGGCLVAHDSALHMPVRTYMAVHQRSTYCFTSAMIRPTMVPSQMREILNALVTSHHTSVEDPSSAVSSMGGAKVPSAAGCAKLLAYVLDDAVRRCMA